MRKLFLLVALAFTAYYGSSLWLFTDADSWKVVNNYLPVALLVGMFIIGLIHIRIALGVAALLFLLLGNPTLLNEFLVNVCHLPGSWAVFNNFNHPMESITLGLFSAWIIIRFFGNPELDYEYNRANAVRTLHFPVFIFGLTAVLAAIYSIVLTNNVFYPDFWTNTQNIVIKYPFAFLGTGTILQPLRTIILLLEGIAIYTIVTNEIRTAKQVRAFMWLLLAGAVIVSILAVVQLIGGPGFTCLSRNTFADGIAFYNKEVNSTFSSPNNLAVFLVAMLPICAAMIIRGKLAGIIGLITGALLIVAIILTATKLAILLSVAFLITVVIIVITRAIKRGSIWPLVLTAVLVVAVLGVYLTAKVAKSKNADAKWASGIVKKVDGTATAFIKGKWDLKSLNKRTNFKSGDWLTAINMITPSSQGDIDNMIIGVGYDRFKNNYQEYRSPAASSRRSAASNMFLQVFAEIGLFGALALALIAIFAVLYGFKASKQLEYPVYVKAVAWSITLLVIGCMTENAFLTYQIQTIFWMLVGLCMVFASLAAKDSARKGNVFFKFIIFILIIASWAWVVYPKFEKQKEQAKVISDLATKYAKRNNLTVKKLEEALRKTKDYNFHRKAAARWSDSSSFVMTKVKKPVMSIGLQCVHPDIASNKPVNASISIDGESLTNVVFYRKNGKVIDIDISKNPKLATYLAKKQNVLVRFDVDRTWNPSVFFPRFKEDNFEVGVSVQPIVWKEIITPVAPPKPEVKPE
ncbi:O-antigen ligase family protein, partial [bacterium]|nr:O-antigen ligase family protein [bacterium]